MRTITVVHNNSRNEGYPDYVANVANVANMKTTLVLEKNRKFIELSNLDVFYRKKTPELRKNRINK